MDVSEGLNDIELARTMSEVRNGHEGPMRMLNSLLSNTTRCSSSRGLLSLGGFGRGGLGGLGACLVGHDT